MKLQFKHYFCARLLAATIAVSTMVVLTMFGYMGCGGSSSSSTTSDDTGGGSSGGGTGGSTQLWIETPTNFTVVFGDGQALISWDNLDGAVQYNIYWSTTEGVTTSSNKIENVVSPYVHTGLTNNTTYYYALMAINSYGDYSMFSDETSTTPKNGVPTLSVSAGIKKNDLSWQEIDGATSYNIYWSDSSGVTIGSTKISGITPTTYSHTGLTNYDNYYYKVAAIRNGAEQTLSDEATGMPKLGPHEKLKTLYTYGSGKNLGYSIALTSSNGTAVGMPGVGLGLGGAAAFCYVICLPDHLMGSGSGWYTSEYGFSIALNNNTTGSKSGVGDRLVGDPNAKVPDELGVQQGGVEWFSDIQTEGSSTLITDDTGASGDLFGFSVAINDTYAVIGAPAQTTHYDKVFYYPLATLTKNQINNPNFLPNQDRFGWSVAVNDDYMLIGAPNYDGGAQTNAGSVYFIKFSDPATFIRKTVSNSVANDYFGRSVSMNGNVAIVGGESDGSGYGVAAIYRYDGSSWNEEKKLTSQTAGEAFGHSVSISGNFAVVGAYNGNGGTGTVYVYKYSNSDWTLVDTLTASDGAVGDQFGFSVATIGNDEISIGAPGVDGGNGEVYFFYSHSTW